MKPQTPPPPPYPWPFTRQTPAFMAALLAAHHAKVRESAGEALL